MRISRVSVFTIAFACACLTLWVPISTVAQTSAPSSITEHHTYVIPTLGIRIGLPGEWHFTQQSSPSSSSAAQQQDPNCHGPLCGKPELDEALERDSRMQWVFLAGYKLGPEYLNRQRYPLQKFAEAMMQGSLGGSTWVVVGSMVEMKIAGQPAYRLLVQDPAKAQKKGFGFVFEAKGYMCLVVGTDVTESQSLLPAVEKMER